VSASASRAEIAVVYVGGVLQGLALVTFPAASAIFTGAGIGFDSTRYGALFLPQVVLAVLTRAGAGAGTPMEPAPGPAGGICR
jgi:hypothetical protein